MRTGVRAWVLVAALLPANAYAGNDYAALVAGYRGAATTLSTADGDASALNHAPRLGFVVYGGDWFLKLRATFVSGVTGDEPHARFVTDMFGGGEVGVHWPRASGNLAVGLLVDGKSIGVREGDGWSAGGRGVDGGVSLHFAFPAWGRVRFDPSIAAGVSVLRGDETYSGVFALGELEVFVRLMSSLSLWLGAGIDVRRYASRADADPFDARTWRFDLGVALHDLWGIGHNAL